MAAIKLFIHYPFPVHPGLQLKSRLFVFIPPVSVFFSILRHFSHPSSSILLHVLCFVLLQPPPWCTTCLCAPMAQGWQWTHTATYKGVDVNDRLDERSKWRCVCPSRDAEGSKPGAKRIAAGPRLFYQRHLTGHYNLHCWSMHVAI